MVERKLLTDSTRKDIKNKNYLKALLQASADLEHLFFSKLLFEKNLKSSLIGNWTLGKYIEWVSKSDLIDNKHISLLKDFNIIRNLIVHDRHSIDKIENDSNKLNSLINILLSICDFIDSTTIKYKLNNELEKEYNIFFERTDKKYGKLV